MVSGIVLKIFLGALNDPFQVHINPIPAKPSDLWAKLFEDLFHFGGEALLKVFKLLDWIILFR
jgi:hypothetical protein